VRGGTLRIILAIGFAVLVGRTGVARAQAAPESSSASVGAEMSSDHDLTENAASPRALLAGAVDPRTYRLGPGDRLSLELSGRTQRLVPLIVDVEGRVNVPDLGVVSVAGRSLEDVRAQLLGRLRPIYPGARVDLRLLVVRAFKVYVSGQVRSPGATAATPITRASELLTGRFELLPGASRRNVELHRRDGTTRRVDLDAFALLGDSGANPPLEDGDILVVPSAREYVYALGAFARPGRYEFSAHDSTATMVALAGELLPGADAARGMLVRFVTPTTMDSMRVDFGSPGGGDAELRPDDRLFAYAPGDYQRPRNVSITGEVAMPGPYSIRPGMDRLSSLLARAGGLTESAARTRIQVFRPGPTTGQRDIEFERLSRLTRSEMTDAEYTAFQTKLASQQAAFVVSADDLGRGGSAFDVVLEDGDILVVGRETAAVRVAGEVKRPALVTYQPLRTGEEYIALAGGFTRRARRGDVRLTRLGSNQTLSLSDVKSVQPGDFIWVPEKKEVNFWGVVKDVILVAGSAATVVLLFHNVRN